MYQCEICGTTFDAPAKKPWSEPMPDSCREFFVDDVCPICGQERFHKVAECPRCGQNMEAGRILCKPCAASLLHRFSAFADTLTAEEEEQLDTWLDGESITDRRSWQC